VLAVPWIRRGALLSRPEHRAKTPEELRRHIEEELARRILVEAERLDRSLPAVLAGHVTVAGAVTSSEVSMTLGRDHVLPLSTVALPGIDYVALGHVHKHQQLGAAPPVVYSGSLQRVDFSEERDVKGFCLVELDPRVPTGSRARWEFVPLAARPFVTINVEVHPDEEPTAAVLREIARTHVAGAIVRVQVRLPEALEGRLDERAVRQALGQAHSIAALTRDVTRQRRPRIGMETRGLTPEEALRRYLDQAQRDLSPQQKERLLQRGLALIQEESSRQGSP
jgi:exonuclease SbcD